MVIAGGSEEWVQDARGTGPGEGGGTGTAAAPPHQAQQGVHTVPSQGKPLLALPATKVEYGLGANALNKAFSLSLVL